MVTQTNKKKGTKAPKAPTKPKASSSTKAVPKKATEPRSKSTKPSKSSGTKATTTKATAIKATTKDSLKTSPSKTSTSSSSKVISTTTKAKTKKAASHKSSEKTMHPFDLKQNFDIQQTFETTSNVRTSILQESMMPYKFAAYHPKSGENYMSDMQLKHFRKILETWKKELMKEVDNTISEMKGASVLADPNDRATQEEAFNLELRTRDRERKLIRKIEEALQQIDDKEYGYCESCGIEIGIRRLEARPTAVLCIDCKTLDEIRERTTQ